jgi:putative ABC transport system permease protein
MNSLKRAWLSVIRKPGKNFLLFFIVTLLTTLMAASLAIRIASNNVTAEMQNRIGLQVSIAPERTELAYGVVGQHIPYSELKKVVSFKGVKSYNYGISYSFQAYKAQQKSMVLVEGTQNPDIKHYWPNSEIIEGRTFTEKELSDGAHVMVVSKQMAQLYNIKVGDNYPLGRKYVMYFDPLEEWFDMEVIGIVDGPEVTRAEPFEGDFEQYMTYYYSETQRDWDRFPIAIAPNIVIDQQIINTKLNYRLVGVNLRQNVRMRIPILEMESFDAVKEMRQLYGKQLPMPFKFNFADDQILAVLGPIGTLNMIAEAVMIFTMIIAVFVCSLIILLYLKERRQEIGIYFALGEKKRNIVIQVVMEVWIVSALAMTLAVFAGTWIARGFSSELIRLQLLIADVQKGKEDIVNDNIPTREEVVAAYTVNMSNEYVLLFIGLSMFTVTASTIVPIVNILKLKPKEILL